MQLDNACVQRFAGLFPGRSDVWGAIQGKTVKEPVTLAHYRRHLEGKISLGIYPLTSQGLVRWLAIDVDLQDPLHTLRLLDALSNLGVTEGVYLERSKSKGFHIMILFCDWVDALEVRRIARTALQEAGLSPTTEVFPKQDRLTRETPWGSYLNLPYFGGDNPEGRRMILDRTTLNPIRLADWLAGVQTFPVDALWSVIGALPGEPETSFPQEHRKTTMPELLSQTHQPGTRRPTLVSLAGHLRVRGVGEDVAVELLLSWAREHFSPPLPDGEIEKHVRGIYRRYGLGNRRPVDCQTSQVLPSIEVSL